MIQSIVTTISRKTGEVIGQEITEREGSIDDSQFIKILADKFKDWEAQQIKKEGVSTCQI